MVKRSRTESNDYETIAKKFKRLERKLLRARRKELDRVQPPRRSLSSSSSSRSSSTSSRSSSASSSSTSARRSAPSRPTAPPADQWLCIEGVPPREYVPEPSTSAATHVPPPASPPPASSPPRAVQPSSSAAQTTAPAEPAVEPSLSATTQLNDELMQLLGEDPSQKKVYGKEIQPDLAVRLQHMTTTGLRKEVRKELMDKYLPPVNCPLIDAPTLNAEVKAAVSEAVFKRDKGIEQKQKQIASAITCVAEALTLLLASEQTNADLIKLLMDAQKLLCDSQNSDSLVRRNFVLFNLKKELKDQLQSTKIDKFLFSEELADTLKAAKAISKSGADLKSAPTKQPPKKPANKQQKNNLNWRVPPQSHRSKGTQKNKGPLSKSRPETSSRHSSRPASSRSHR